MAIRELFSVISADYAVTSGLNIHAGMILARDAATGNAVVADRNTSANQYLGLAADDTARTNNTMIIVDPVGATAIAADASFIANNNGFYSATKRALADYQDETVSNVSDLNSGSTGYQGPRRGIGVYTTPSGQFIVDTTACLIGYAVNGGTTADTTASTWVIGDLLTCGTNYGATTGAGKFVKCDTNLAYGRPIARIDSIDLNTNLVWITMLPAPTTWIAA